MKKGWMVQPCEWTFANRSCVISWTICWIFPVIIIYVAQIYAFISVKFRTSNIQGVFWKYGHLFTHQLNSTFWIYAPFCYISFAYDVFKKNLIKIRFSILLWTLSLLWFDKSSNRISIEIYQLYGLCFSQNHVMKVKIFFYFL